MTTSSTPTLSEAGKAAKADPNVLYRFYSANDALLYIGITRQFGVRLKQHGREKEWFPQVAYIRVEHFDTRAAVEAAERQAIASEGPRWNSTLHPESGRRGTDGALWLSIEAARKKLGDVVEAVTRRRVAGRYGDHAVLTRHGQPSAVIVPIDWYRQMRNSTDDPTDL